MEKTSRMYAQAKSETRQPDTYVLCDPLVWEYVNHRCGNTVKQWEAASDNGAFIKLQLKPDKWRSDHRERENLIYEINKVGCVEVDNELLSKIEGKDSPKFPTRQCYGSLVKVAGTKDEIESLKKKIESITNKPNKDKKKPLKTGTSILYDGLVWDYIKWKNDESYKKMITELKVETRGDFVEILIKTNDDKHKEEAMSFIDTTRSKLSRLNVEPEMLKDLEKDNATANTFVKRTSAYGKCVTILGQKKDIGLITDKMAKIVAKQEDAKQKEAKVDAKQQDAKVDGKQKEAKVEGKQKEAKVEGKQKEAKVDGKQKETKVDGKQKEAKVDGKQKEAKVDGKQREDLSLRCDSLLWNYLDKDDTIPKFMVKHDIILQEPVPQGEIVTINFEKSDKAVKAREELSHMITTAEKETTTEQISSRDFERLTIGDNKEFVHSKVFKSNAKRYNVMGKRSVIEDLRRDIKRIGMNITESVHEQSGISNVGPDHKEDFAAPSVTQVPSQSVGEADKRQAESMGKGNLKTNTQLTHATVSATVDKNGLGNKNKQEYIDQRDDKKTSEANTSSDSTSGTCNTGSNSVGKNAQIETKTDVQDRPTKRQAPQNTVTGSNDSHIKRNTEREQAQTQHGSKQSPKADQPKSEEKEDNKSELTQKEITPKGQTANAASSRPTLSTLPAEYSQKGSPKEQSGSKAEHKAGSGIPKERSDNKHGTVSDNKQNTGDGPLLLEEMKNTRI